MAISEDEKYFATSGLDGFIKIWCFKDANNEIELISNIEYEKKTKKIKENI